MSDPLQAETLQRISSALEAARRLPEYIREPAPMPLFLWLRYLTAQALQALHRHHLGAQAREAGREISIDGGRVPQALGYRDGPPVTGAVARCGRCPGSPGTTYGPPGVSASIRPRANAV